MLLPKTIKLYNGRMFGSFVESFLYHNGIIGSRSVVPPLGGWDLTYYCEGKCQYCVKKTDLDFNKELSTEERLKVINDMGAMKLAFLTIGGGEPTDVEDFPKIVDAIKANKIILNTDTNGLRTIEFCETLLKSDFVTFSIDSVNPDTFMKLRGYSLEDVETNLMAFIESRDRSKADCKINVRMVVNPQNQNELYEFYMRWKDQVDSIQFQPIHDDSDVFFKDIKGTVDPLIIKEQISKIAQIDSQFRKAYYRNLYLFFFEKEKLRTVVPSCKSFYYFIDIDPYGYVYNCGGHKQKVGDLRINTLKEIVNSKEHKSEVDHLNKNCFCYYHCAILNHMLRFL